MLPSVMKGRGGHRTLTWMTSGYPSICFRKPSNVWFGFRGTRCLSGGRRGNPALVAVQTPPCFWMASRSFSSSTLRSSSTLAGSGTGSSNHVGSPFDAESITASAAAALSHGGVEEPAFSTLGLAHGFPSGWCQAIMEVLHVNASLPWWATITTMTLMIRIVLLPIVIKNQRNMVRMNHSLPEMQRLQVALIRNAGTEEGRAASRQLETFMKEKGINPAVMYVPIVAQGIVFTSMFFGIRGMASVPVESMRSGGMGWFTDLTTADPILLLPVLTAATLFVSIRTGAEGIDPNTVPPFMRVFMNAMPILSLPIMCQFCAALNVYWLSNNLITLAQINVLRSKSFRTRLGIGQMKSWRPEDLPMNNLSSVLKPSHSKDQKNERSDSEDQKP